MDIESVGKLVVVVLILLIALIVGVIYKFIIDKKFQNSISQTKLVITSGLEAKNGVDICYIYVSNRSFSNVILKSLGFMDELKENDYIKKYMADNNINDGQGVVIQARSSIKLEIDFEEIYNIYADFKISAINAYTLDSLGFKRIKKARIIRKQIKNIAKPIFALKKKQMKEEAKALSKENIVEDDNKNEAINNVEEVKSNIGFINENIEVADENIETIDDVLVNNDEIIDQVNDNITEETDTIDSEDIENK